MLAADAGVATRKMPESSLPSGARSRDHVPLFFLAAIVTKRAPSKPAKAFRLTTGSAAVALNPPDFGPPSPSQDSIDAGKTERVLKDVLKVGRWKTGYDEAGRPEFWDVSPATLENIAKDFHAMKAAGVGSNLGKGHGDDNLIIASDDLIAPIADIKIANNTLWIACYVTPEEKQYLRNPARKVSVGVVPNWQDGRGKTYSMALVHVAVTDRPVVAGQGPFLALADSVTGGSGMDFAALLAAINTFMEALGFSPLPDDTTDANIVDRLVGVAAAMGTKPEEPEPAGPEVPDAPEWTPSMDMTGIPAPMADKLRPIFAGFESQLKAMSDQLAAVKKKEDQAEKSAFNQKVGQLLVSGVPKTILDGKIALADKLKSFDLALLDGLAPVLNTGSNSKARKLADPNPPIPGGNEPSAEERRKSIAKEIAARRNISVEAALKFVPTI